MKGHGGTQWGPYPTASQSVISFEGSTGGGRPLTCDFSGTWHQPSPALLSDSHLEPPLPLSTRPKTASQGCALPRGATWAPSPKREPPRPRDPGKGEGWGPPSRLRPQAPTSPVLLHSPYLSGGPRRPCPPPAGDHRAGRAPGPRAARPGREPVPRAAAPPSAAPAGVRPGVSASRAPRAARAAAPLGSPGPWPPRVRADVTGRGFTARPGDCTSPCGRGPGGAPAGPALVAWGSGAHGDLAVSWTARRDPCPKCHLREGSRERLFSAPTTEGAAVNDLGVRTRLCEPPRTLVAAASRSF